MQQRSIDSPRVNGPRCVTVLAACLLAAACSRGRGEEGGDRSEGEGTHDFVRFNPGSAPLDFIKIEAVAETAGATSVTLPGRVTFDEDHTQRVASPIDGRAVSILAKLGDKVRAGQPLIELSSPNVGQLQADAQKAMSELSLADKATERVHKLQAEGAVADKDVAQAENDFRKAKSDSARTAAQLKSLGVSPTDPAVNVALRAQIPGVVVERNVLVGQEVRADQVSPLVTITSLDTVWVQADAYEQDLALVAEGDAVTIRVPAYPAEAFPGKVGHVGEVVDAASRTVKVRCLVDNKSRKLKPEMFARVDVLNAAGHKLILVPSQAVLNDGDRSVVIVASEGNVFRSRRVEVGPETEGKVRVLTGLHAGEKIVTDGAIFMKREIDTQ
ncbi:MAG TPA: efflux RND transporter periplasmic adaptor subunit [Polyangia bacterium]|jgi:cobalt-zinc-cadmium efflux system membrane fusion protein|nr:efflux RND transporter periplasmic adaptor subunit [Polyangia bacterium]